MDRTIRERRTPRRMSCIVVTVSVAAWMFTALASPSGAMVPGRDGRILFARCILVSKCGFPFVEQTRLIERVIDILIKGVRADKK